MLAKKGYIIWICDNQTASNKGVNSAWPLYKNFGELELLDLEEGYAWLKSQPYVDGSRIGLWGWSYGGLCDSHALAPRPRVHRGRGRGRRLARRRHECVLT